MNEVKAYQCDYCKRISLTKTGIKLHENHCTHNPKINHCANCVYGCLKEKFEYESFGFGNPEKTKISLGFEPYCKQHEMFIFQEDKTGNAYFMECEVEYGYNGTERVVPYTCFYFESKGKNGFEKEVTCKK